MNSEFSEIFFHGRILSFVHTLTHTHTEYTGEVLENIIKIRTEKNNNIRLDTCVANNQHYHLICTSSFFLLLLETCFFPSVVH